MLADDMGLGDTSAYQDFTGNSDRDQIHTPSMERLARMGVRFTDAHTPGSRCTTTRYGLLTGRYPWRSRLKHWVLFGSQGDPMIERDRPTIATMLRDHNYRTAMVGKWHVGLRYRRSDASPAAGWHDADLQQPLFDTPLDHGFDQCWFTSRSHGTSGPRPSAKGKARNGAKQSVGPGHIHGRTVVAATGDGKRLLTSGPHSYVLESLGSRHSENAIRYIHDHVTGIDSSEQPFFLYYACNSNHSPYTPATQIGDVPVAGAGRNVAGDAMDARCDFVYENDVALGRLIDYLSVTPDPRNHQQRLIENTMIIFTSDNGAERDTLAATGPFRSNKGSIYEGGHRVPFIVSWPAGGVGDGEQSDAGATNGSLIGLHQLYATFADAIGAGLPDLMQGAKGAEDSVSVLDAFRGATETHAMFFSDHKQAVDDPAMLALRVDQPVIDGQVVPGKWKILFDSKLVREGVAQPVELYDLASDPREQTNRLDDEEHDRLVAHLSSIATACRNRGGHRYPENRLASSEILRWGEFASGDDSTTRIPGRYDGLKQIEQSTPSGVTVTLRSIGAAEEYDLRFSENARGLGIEGGEFKQVDAGEEVEIVFDCDVVVQSVGVVAGNGVCGGFYQVADRSPLAIYCVDADNDAKDQTGLITDIGLMRQGEVLRISSRPHYGVQAPGRWRLQQLAFRRVQRNN